MKNDIAEIKQFIKVKSIELFPLTGEKAEFEIIFSLAEELYETYKDNHVELKKALSNMFFAGTFHSYSPNAHC